MLIVILSWENYPTKKTRRAEIKNILKGKKSGIEEIQMKTENEWVSKGELINPIKNVSVENSRVEKFLFFQFFSFFSMQFKENIIGQKIFDE